MGINQHGILCTETMSEIDEINARSVHNKLLVVNSTRPEDANS